MAKKKYNVIREEMLQVASNVAQEKNIDQDSVFSAMEQALEKAARVKYGQEIDIRISIDRSTGDIKLNSYLEVVANIEEEFQSKQILLEDAKKINPVVGYTLEDKKSMDWILTFGTYRDGSDEDGARHCGRTRRYCATGHNGCG